MSAASGQACTLAVICLPAAHEALEALAYAAYAAELGDAGGCADALIAATAAGGNAFAEDSPAGSALATLIAAVGMAVDLASTEWRPVAGWEGLYEVSNDGQVRSLPRIGARSAKAHGGNLLKPAFDGHYLSVQLHDGDRTCRRRVHKLVAEAFIGPCPDGQEVRHWNGNHLDNRAANLLYGTRTENRGDSIRLGTLARGTGIRGARLTDSAVREIRQRYAADEATQEALAAEHGVSEATIGRAVRGETWSHVEMPDPARPRADWRRGERNVKATLTEQQVQTIRERYAAGGITQASLAAEYGVNQTTISLIVRRKGWRDLQNEGA